MFNTKHEFIMALMMGRLFKIGSLIYYYDEKSKNPWRKCYPGKKNGLPMNGYDWNYYNQVKEI